MDIVALEKKILAHEQKKQEWVEASIYLQALLEIYFDYPVSRRESDLEKIEENLRKCKSLWEERLNL